MYDICLTGIGLWTSLVAHRNVYLVFLVCCACPSGSKSRALVNEGGVKKNEPTHSPLKWLAGPSENTWKGKNH